MIQLSKAWIFTLSYWVFSLSFEFFSPWVFFSKCRILKPGLLTSQRVNVHSNHAIQTDFTIWNTFVSHIHLFGSDRRGLHKNSRHGTKHNFFSQVCNERQMSVSRPQWRLSLFYSVTSYRCGIFFAGRGENSRPRQKIYIIPKRFATVCSDGLKQPRNFCYKLVI